MKRLALLLLALTTLAPAQTVKPRLVVLVSIDQFRQDYLRRFASNYLPARQGNKVGGFRFLTQTGADYVDGHHGHIPTATGPGHAALLTGSAASLNGIIGNEWKDRTTGKTVYCVEDPTVETVGGTSKPMSPRNLLTTTVGDELKLATGGKAKVVSISMKDRSAILMSGHASDTVIWFDNMAAGWVTSSFYAPSRALPTWVREINAEGFPKASLTKTWKPLLPTERYATTKAAPFVKPDAPFPFEHQVRTITNFWTSPYGNEFTLDTAKRALVAERLGEDAIPDLLTVSFSSNDYVGHTFGPNSPQVMDMCVRTDRMLSDLFNTIDKTVPGGLGATLIILSADHGVLPIAEEAQALRIPSKRFDVKAMLKALGEGLSLSFGEGEWVIGIDEQNLYLNPRTIGAKNLTPETVQTRAAELLSEAPGVYVALTKAQILKGQVPATNWGQLIARSFHPRLSGDLIVLEQPGAYFALGTGTGHGSAWEHDSHVPIVFRGPGVVPGLYGRRVYTQDIASTLCTILGIEYPTGNMGKPLLELLKK